jgi:hypothetical protein
MSGGGERGHDDVITHVVRRLFLSVFDETFENREQPFVRILIYDLRHFSDFFLIIRQVYVGSVRPLVLVFHHGTSVSFSPILHEVTEELQTC